MKDESDCKLYGEDEKLHQQYVYFKEVLYGSRSSVSFA
jgi:hypothetical protein